jgi:hypothetical protein
MMRMDDSSEGKKNIIVIADGKSSHAFTCDNDVNPGGPCRQRRRKVPTTKTRAERS